MYMYLTVFFRGQWIVLIKIDFCEYMDFLLFAGTIQHWKLWSNLNTRIFHGSKGAPLLILILILIVSQGNTPFAVHYEKIRIHLREKATNSAKIHSLARKSKHLRINQIQLRFLNFNQHSITILGIHFCHSTYKREKYTLINAKIRVINIILRIIRGNRQTFKCKRYSLTFLWHCLQFNSIPGQL